MSRKNFHRHIDECNQSKFEKHICKKCLRYCVNQIIDDEGTIYHLHKCSREKKRIRMLKRIKKKSIQRRLERARNSEYKLRSFDLPTKEHFTLFQTAKILNTENNLRNQVYHDSLTFSKYIGNLYRAIELDYIIASQALFLNCWSPKMVDKYFEYCGSYFNLLRGNIRHSFVKNRKNLMSNKSRYSKEYENLHPKVKYTHEIVDAYLLSCNKKRLYDLKKRIEMKLSQIETDKRIKKIEENF